MIRGSHFLAALWPVACMLLPIFLLGHKVPATEATVIGWADVLRIGCFVVPGAVIGYIAGRASKGER